ncbi:MAG: Hint domain-containing protein [Sedimentitalea sp.]
MAWIALKDKDGSVFAPAGLDRPRDGPDLIDTGRDALMVRGSLVIETDMPVVHRPKPLLFLSRHQAWPFQMSLQALPQGGLALILEQGDDMQYHALNPSDQGRTDLVRLTYSWDAPARWGQIALERGDNTRPILIDAPSPKPFSMNDLQALIEGTGDSYYSPHLQFLALSTSREPVGPMPALGLATPIATPQGPRSLADLRRGDLVITPDGNTVPVLHRITRTVPARGSFAPIRLNAPYFGLTRDIDLAPSQRLVMSGTEVEYLFGHETVMIPVAQVSGRHRAAPAPARQLVTYSQLLLPNHEPLLAAGTPVESLYIGRLRRQRRAFDASLLAGCNRQRLPDHRQPSCPVLKGFDARVLVEHRAA